MERGFKKLASNASDRHRATRVPADTNDKVLLRVPVDGELVGPRIELHGTASRIVLVVVGVGALGHGEVTASQHQWVVEVEHEVRLATLFSITFHGADQTTRRRGQRRTEGREADG